MTPPAREPEQPKPMMLGSGRRGMMLAAMLAAVAGNDPLPMPREKVPDPRGFAPPELPRPTIVQGPETRQQRRARERAEAKAARRSAP